MKSKEEKEIQRYEYEIKCFIREKMQSGKKEEQIIEALQIEKNINRDDAVSFMNKLKTSETKDIVSNDITWGTILFIGGGILMLIAQIQPTNNNYRLLVASAAMMLYGAFRLLRGILSKIKGTNYRLQSKIN